jgi:hypothetical protein
MKYIYAYRYLFESPKWMTNLLAAIVCQIVPIVGPMVLLGYAFEMIESLHRQKGSRYPDFDTNQLMNYLTRGVWPFLVQVIVSIPILAILMVAYLCLGVGTAVAPERSRGVVLVMFLLVFYAAMLVLSVLIVLVMLPLMLRAGLTQDLGQSFSMAFVQDFIKRVWLETILQQLFLVGTSMVLAPLGILACFVGVYVVAGMIAFAQYHLMYQIYELYLERGGTPIPLKAGPAALQPNDIPSASAGEEEGVKPADPTQ